MSLYGADRIVCGTDGSAFVVDWTRKASAEAQIGGQRESRSCSAMPGASSGGAAIPIVSRCHHKAKGYAGPHLDRRTPEMARLAKLPHYSLRHARINIAPIRLWT